MTLYKGNALAGQRIKPLEACLADAMDMDRDEMAEKLVPPRVERSAPEILREAEQVASAAYWELVDRATGDYRPMDRSNRMFVAETLRRLALELVR
jgi:hypothetical protein